MKKIFLIVIIALIGLMIYSMLAQETIHDVAGGFEETVFIRNENNTGPVVRVYAYTVQDTLWQNMQKHGDLLPHNKYGTTVVYYFLNSGKSPQSLKLEEPRLASEFQDYCIAKFIKDGQGRTSLTRYPFKEK